MKTLRAIVALLWLVPSAFAADVKISDLPLSVSPTDLTYIEIADMLATPKSAKYLLTNLTTRAEFLDATNFFTLVATNIYVTNLFATTITNVNNAYITNLYVTNLIGSIITNINNTYTTNLFATNIYTTNLFATIITNVNNTYTTNLFATNLFVTNLFATTITNVNNTYTTNLYVTNLYTTNVFVSTNITFDQHITIKNNSTLFFTNNTYVTTNTFLFVNSTGGVVSATLHGTNGVKVTNGTNITANLAAGANVTLTTNSGVITITSAGSGLGTPGTVISGNTPSDLNNLFIPDDLSGTNGVWTTFDTVLSALPGYSGTGTNYLGDDGEFHPFVFDYIYAGTLIVETNMVFTNLTASRVLALDASKNVTNLPAGSNGQVLIYDSGSAGGAKWTNSPSGATINASDGVIPVRSSASAFTDSPLTVSGGNITTAGNLLTSLSVGATNYFNLNFPTQTNNVTANLAFSFGTNGVAGYSGTAMRKFLNVSGGDLTVTWPTIASGVNGWRTNPASALPPAFTNGTWTTVLVEFCGPTDTLARQTNVQVIGVRYN